MSVRSDELVESLTPIALDDVHAAQRRLESVVHRTPLLHSRTLDALTGSEGCYLKAENVQRAGAFKIRGAFNAIACLTSQELQRGVVTASSGNHAQAVALAARLHGIPAVALMPNDAPEAKVSAVRAYGAEVVTFDRYAENRDELLRALASERELVPIHAYDDWNVIAGQGTVALELFEERGVDTLVVPVGGGGLIAGCATAAKGVRAGVRVVGVEPERGDDVRRSLLHGERVVIETPRTIADGQQLTTPGERPFVVIRRQVSEVVLVSDAEIAGAMRFAFERLKIVLEPSGACALAAVMTGKVETSQRTLGVVLSGGNVDPETFGRLIA